DVVAPIELMAAPSCEHVDPARFRDAGRGLDALWLLVVVVVLSIRAGARRRRRSAIAPGRGALARVVAREPDVETVHAQALLLERSTEIRARLPERPA